MSADEETPEADSPLEKAVGVAARLDQDLLGQNPTATWSTPAQPMSADAEAILAQFAPGEDPVKAIQTQLTEVQEKLVELRDWRKSLNAHIAALVERENQLKRMANAAVPLKERKKDATK